jgi:hypothetical protein
VGDLAAVRKDTRVTQVAAFEHAEHKAREFDMSRSATLDMGTGCRSRPFGRKPQQSNSPRSPGRNAKLSGCGTRTISSIRTGRCVCGWR